MKPTKKSKRTPSAKKPVAPKPRTVTLTISPDLNPTMQEYIEDSLNKGARAFSILPVFHRINSVIDAMMYSETAELEFRPEGFEREIIAVAIAELMSNKATPDCLKDAIEAHLIAVAKSTGTWGWRDADDDEDIDKWYPRSPRLISENPKLAPINEGKAARVVEAITVMLDAMPEKTRKMMLDTLDQWQADSADTDTSRDPQILRLWVPRVLANTEAKGGDNDAK